MRKIVKLLKYVWNENLEHETKQNKSYLYTSPKSRARPSATQQGCAKCGGTSPCQRSKHRKKFRRKVVKKINFQEKLIQNVLTPARQMMASRQIFEAIMMKVEVLFQTEWCLL